MLLKKASFFRQTYSRRLSRCCIRQSHGFYTTWVRPYLCGFLTCHRHGLKRRPFAENISAILSAVSGNLNSLIFCSYTDATPNCSSLKPLSLWLRRLRPLFDATYFSLFFRWQWQWGCSRLACWEIDPIQWKPVSRTGIALADAMATRNSVCTSNCE